MAGGGDDPDPDRFADTVDWESYWRSGGDPHADAHGYPASVSAGHFERLERFFDEVGVPDDAAFVGCGTGDLAAAVAEAYPTRVVGYDAASAAVERARGAYGDVSGLSFRVARLPDFDVDRRFELVFCYATLHYVREVETAIAALYRRVRPGGHLVCNVPNEHTSQAHADAEGPLRERFALVADGENLTSRERIADRLDAEVRDFWAAVDADGPFVRPANPCLVVER